MLSGSPCNICHYYTSFFFLKKLICVNISNYRLIHRGPKSSTFGEPCYSSSKSWIKKRRLRYPLQKMICRWDFFQFTWCTFKSKLVVNILKLAVFILLKSDCSWLEKLKYLAPLNRFLTRQQLARAERKGVSPP